MQIQVLTDDIWHSLEVYLMSGSNVLYIQCEFINHIIFSMKC